MISLIERGESSATAVVLEKLAVSLGVSLAALFEDPQAPASPWVLDGSIEVALGEARHRLDAGDCLAMPLAGPTAYRNPGRKAARYLVAITGDGHATRRRP
jgi:transcriptional regulator with XRE-family HTH domain